MAFSEDRLSDGRPAWVGMDVGAYNHVAPGLAAVEATTRCVKQPTLRCDRWSSNALTRAKRKGKKRMERGGKPPRSRRGEEFRFAWPAGRNPPAPPPSVLSGNWKRLAWCSLSSRTPSPTVVIACTENPCKRLPCLPRTHAVQGLPSAKTTGLAARVKESFAGGVNSTSIARIRQLNALF